MEVDWNVLIGEAVTQLIRIFVPVAVVLCFRWVVQIWKQIKEKHPEIAELIAYAARVGYAAAEEEYRNYPAAAGGDKMAFALYRAEDYLKACGVKVNDDVMRDAIHEYGIDNYKFSWTKPNIADVLADIRKAEEAAGAEDSDEEEEDERDSADHLCVGNLWDDHNADHNPSGERPAGSDQRDAEDQKPE